MITETLTATQKKDRAYASKKYKEKMKKGATGQWRAAEDAAWLARIAGMQIKTVIRDYRKAGWGWKFIFHAMKGRDRYPTMKVGQAIMMLGGDVNLDDQRPSEELIEGGQLEEVRTYRVPSWLKKFSKDEFVLYARGQASSAFLSTTPTGRGDQEDLEEFNELKRREQEVRKLIKSVYPIARKWWAWDSKPVKAYHFFYDRFVKKKKVRPSDYGFKPEADKLFELKNDPQILKAVFLAGANGKERMQDAMFAGTGFKSLDSDQRLKRFVKAANTSLDSSSERNLFARARSLRDGELAQHATQRLPLIVDATTWNHDRIVGPVKQLRRLGYDCYMVFADAPLHESQRNIKNYVHLFGAENFFLLDNDKDLPLHQWSSVVAPTARKVARTILARRVSNPIGRKWAGIGSQKPQEGTIQPRQATFSDSPRVQGVITKRRRALEKPKRRKKVGVLGYLVAKLGPDEAADVYVEMAGPDFKALRKNQVDLTDAERKKLYKANVLWHPSHRVGKAAVIDPNTGRRRPKVELAAFKSVVGGKTYYVSNTHRMFATAPTIAGIIKKFQGPVRASA